MAALRSEAEPRNQQSCIAANGQLRSLEQTVYGVKCQSQKMTCLTLTIFIASQNIPILGSLHL